MSSGTELKRQQGTKNERKKNCTVVFEVSFFMGKPCIHIRQFKFGQRLNFKISKLRAIYIRLIKVLMQEKLFQRCTLLLYCSVLSPWAVM